MSEASKASSANGSMKISISGRIKGHRFYEKTYYTELTIPAPDPYSQPSVVEVRSSNRLGQSDEDVSINCQLSGFYGRSYSFTDKKSGEVVNRRPVNLVLDVIDG